MLDNLFRSIIVTSLDAKSFFLCTLVSVLMGLALAFSHLYKSKSTRNFSITVAMLPLIVQVVIMMVNRSLGAGVAVAGAFSLTRFRSAPGTAKEICCVFASMAVGLATGMGYIWLAVIFGLLFILLNLLYTTLAFTKDHDKVSELKITIPEGLDYIDLFDDIFEKYTVSHDLVKVRTSGMGSLYNLTYTVELKSEREQKKMVDEIRCRNGNLDISLGRPVTPKEEQ